MTRRRIDDSSGVGFDDRAGPVGAPTEDLEPTTGGLGSEAAVEPELAKRAETVRVTRASNIVRKERTRESTPRAPHCGVSKGSRCQPLRAGGQRPEPVRLVSDLIARAG